MPDNDITKRDTSIPVWVWLAIAGVGVALIFLVWMALGGESIGDRFGLQTQDTEQQNSESSGESPTLEELDAALESARVRLEEVERKIQTERVSEAMIEEVRDIKADLKLAYENAGKEAKAIWKEIDEGLEEFEQNLRSRAG